MRHRPQRRRLYRQQQPRPATSQQAPPSLPESGGDGFVVGASEAMGFVGGLHEDVDGGVWMSTDSGSDMQSTPRLMWDAGEAFGFCTWQLSTAQG